MSDRPWQQRFQDILDSANQISIYIQGMTYHEFVNDKRTFHSVLHNFVVIGEAANHVPSEIRSQLLDVPWGDVIGTRNKIVHAYFNIRPRLIWLTATEDLLPLASRLQSYLQSPHTP